MTDHYKYFGFVSYSSLDSKWAKWLHRALENYRVPGRLVGTLGRDGAVPRRVRPLFRDRDELPTSSDLGGAIKAALEQSRYLIVLCSPNSAKSHWVRQEIKAFKVMGRSGRILCLIVDGEPNVSEGSEPAENECFAPELRFDVLEDGSLSDQRAEPIAADVRPGMDGRANAKLKMLAGILGIDFDALKQREKRRHRQRQLIWGAIATLLIMAGSSYWYQQELKEHALEQQVLIEESRRLAASSIAQTEQGNTAEGIRLALQALPANPEEPDRPRIAEAEQALRLAQIQPRAVAFIVPDDADGTLTGPNIAGTPFSPDGRFVAIAPGPGVHLLDRKTGAIQATFEHTQTPFFLGIIYLTNPLYKCTL